MEMPKPTAAHARLAALAGTWEGDETIAPSPWGEGGPARGRCELRMDLDGFFLISNYVEKMDGVVTYRGHGVYGYDPAASCYTMHWFDSMGGSYEEPAKGDWEGNSLIFHKETPHGRARSTHTIDGDAYSFRIDVSQDGETWQPMMEGHYSRA